MLEQSQQYSDSYAAAGGDGALDRARAFEAGARATVQSLTGKFAWHTILHFLGVFAALALVSWLTISGVLSYWVAVPLNALIIYFIFAPLHEATHENIVPCHWRNRWLENLIGHISGYLLLAPYPGFKVLHRHHHNHTNDPAEDPDYWVKSNNYLVVILRCLLIQPAYVIHLFKIARDPATMRVFIWEMVYLVSYIPVIAGSYALGFGNELVLLWILPGYFGVVMCPLNFDWPVHHPHSERGRYTDSAILLFPRPLRAVMEFYFQGHSYHLMHHMYPRIPYYHYGTAYYALERELAAVGPKIRRIGA